MPNGTNALQVAQDSFKSLIANVLEQFPWVVPHERLQSLEGVQQVSRMLMGEQVQIATDTSRHDVSTLFESHTAKVEQVEPLEPLISEIPLL